MTTLYVVTSGEYSDYGIDAIFSTEELANTFIKESHRGDIEHWELDDPMKQDMANRVTYNVWMKGNGDGYSSNEDITLASMNKRNDDVNVMFTDDSHNEITGIFVTSYISKDHAIKLAAEARQEWLRTKAGV